MNEMPREACPPLADLLRISDGEGTPTERRAIAGHLWTCERCRERVAALESLAIECASSFAPPADFEAEEARRFAEGLHKHRRIMDTVRRAPLTWMSMAAAVIAFAIVVLLSQSQATLVQADELLARVAHAEGGRDTIATTRPRVRVQWTPVVDALRNDTYPAFAIIRSLHAGRVVEPWTGDATLRMLSSHGVDWATPLRIGRVLEWRNSLRERRERVTVVDGRLLLRISTNESALRLVEIHVVPDTYEVVREAFVIDGTGRLEIESLTEPRRTATSPPSVSNANPHTPTEADLADALERVELRVRHALHATQLDLDPEIRVSVAEGTSVRVEGAASAQARYSLNQRVAGERLLEVALRLKASGNAVGIDAAMLRPAAPIRDWLRQTFGEGNAEARERFLTELAGATNLAVRQLTALQELDRRYPAIAVSRMSLASRLSLRALLDQHYTDLNVTLDHLAGKTAVLRGSPAGLPVSLRTAPADWRARTRGAVKAADAVRQTLQTLVNLDEPLAADRARDSFDQMFQSLWRTVNSPAAMR